MFDTPAAAAAQVLSLLCLNVFFVGCSIDARAHTSPSSVAFSCRAPSQAPEARDLDQEAMSENGIKIKVVRVMKC